MLFWQGFLVLSIVAALFILWPTIVVHLKRRKKELMLQNRHEINEVVFKDQLKELEATHGRGEIEASELRDLKQDLEKTHIYESAQVSGHDRPIIANWRSRIPVICLALAVPLVTLLIYFQIGAKQDWDIYQMRREFIQSQEPEAVELGSRLIKALQNRLESKPHNGHNWYLLGRTAIEVGDYEEAVRAFRKLHELEPDSALVLAELTQALFRWAGAITPEVRTYIQRTLQLQDDVPSILGLAGIDAFQNARYQEAIDFWTRAVNKLNPHSADYQVLSNGIAQAQSALNGAGAIQAAEAKSSETAAPKSVSVRVSLGEKVEVGADATVFVYARAWQGPRIPLAIQRLNVKDLPSTVKLDESMAMDPNRSLATASQVEIVARVSNSGNAVPQPGDWEGAVGPVVPGSPGKRVKLVIENQIER